jgi:hypothetical protein
VRKRQYPIIGEGGGVSSFIHLDDAAAAIEDARVSSRIVPAAQGR